MLKPTYEGEKMKKKMVLLSGGVDSATCLAMMIESCGKENVMALNIYYGQKHKKEIQCARNIASHYGIKLEEFDLKAIMESSDCPLLQSSDREIIHESYAEQLAKRPGTVDTYVPFRNGLMLSIATARALINDCDEICYGAHSDDACGSAYPDCTPMFYQAMNDAIYEGSGHLVTLSAPLLYFTKVDVVKEGLRLGVPYELTWSCYEGGEEPCHTCGTCIDRENAFKLNGVTDPLCRE